MYCIQENDKPQWVWKTLNRVQLVENKIILPITGDETLKSSKVQKLAKKTKKVLSQTVSKKIVISRKIQKQKEYVNFLREEGFEISDGRWLFEMLSCHVLDYMIKRKKVKKQDMSISILVNDLTENRIAILRKIAKEYKRVNVVTKHIEKLKRIEEQILEEDGIMITVGNNKKKGIAKSEIILNIDFSSKLLADYNIYEEAWIINIKENIVMTKKRFNGITINNYDITFKNAEDYDYDKMTKYKACEMYEASINKKQPFYEITRKMKSDRVEIKKLMGKNAIY